MNKEDKIHAEKVLEIYSSDHQVDGLQFGISPGAIKIHFTNFHDLLIVTGHIIYQYRIKMVFI